MEYAVVPEGEQLEKAIYGWIEGIPVTLGNKMIKGSSILSIEPHYHAYTGWYESYQPSSGDDWLQIKRDCPNFDGIIEGTKQYVMTAIQNNDIAKVGSGGSVALLEAPKQEPSEATKQLSAKMKA